MVRPSLIFRVLFTDDHTCKGMGIIIRFPTFPGCKMKKRNFLSSLNSPRGPSNSSWRCVCLNLSHPWKNGWNIKQVKHRQTAQSNRIKPAPLSKQTTSNWPHPPCHERSSFRMAPPDHLGQTWIWMPWDVGCRWPSKSETGWPMKFYWATWAYYYMVRYRCWWLGSVVVVHQWDSRDQNGMIGKKPR